MIEKRTLLAASMVMDEAYGQYLKRPGGGGGAR